MAMSLLVGLPSMVRSLMGSDIAAVTTSPIRGRESKLVSIRETRVGSWESQPPITGRDEVGKTATTSLQDLSGFIAVDLRLASGLSTSDSGSTDRHNPRVKSSHETLLEESAREGLTDSYRSTIATAQVCGLDLMNVRMKPPVLRYSGSR